MGTLFKIHNFFINRVYAQNLGGAIESGIGKIEGGGDMDKVTFVNTIVEIAVPVAVLCLIVLVVYAGYMLISSQGNPDKLKEGKEVLTNAIIGFFIVLLSVVILLLISNSLDLKIYN